MAVGENKERDRGHRWKEESIKEAESNHTYPPPPNRPTETQLHLPTHPKKHQHQHFPLFLLSLRCPFLSANLVSMEESKQQGNGSWLSVPQFGDWDQKGAFPDYSLDFSKIRETRKQNKRDPSRVSLGNEEDFINPTAPANAPPPSNVRHFDQNHSPTARRSFFSYFNCCVKA